ncbi:MAG: methyltransferase domain-containing protein [Flavobacteriaceae bacterium]|nr:methyltransferase domain-containing protein [Flavobacteriaceae bacterium]
MSVLLGKALLHYLKQPKDADIISFTSLGEEDVTPLAYFFRDFETMPEIEQRALDMAIGSILDVGAGSGAHSLILQERGFDVTALDSAPGAVACCRKRGVKKVVHAEIREYQEASFDTVYMLMNGIGVAGSLRQLDSLLLHLKKIVKPGGQIILDSSDIRYMFDLDQNGSPIRSNEEGYYGDILFSLYYDGEYEPPFPWVYVDYQSLAKVAVNCGLTPEKVIDGPHFDYLARLTRN